jgi:pimeloyl-ACP methyl ester carboxylesterase
MIHFGPKSRAGWTCAILAPGSAILLLCLGFRHIEDINLFHPEEAIYPNPVSALQGHLLKDRIQDVRFQSRDGTMLDAWYIPPRENNPTVVFAHGNGGNIGDRLSVIEIFTRAGYGFFAFDYRGYGKSEGVPSEQGLYQDMEAASHYLKTVQHTPLSKQIALGGSLGSGVVVDVATRLPFRAVVIFATLTSTPDVAEYILRNTYGRYLPVQFIMAQRFDSLSKVGKIQSPLIIMHGTNDHMMPLWMPKALYAKAKTPYKKLLIIPGAGHNDVLERGSASLLQSLHELLQQSQTG